MSFQQAGSGGGPSAFAFGVSNSGQSSSIANWGESSAAQLTRRTSAKDVGIHDIGERGRRTRTENSVHLRRDRRDDIIKRRRSVCGQPSNPCGQRSNPCGHHSNPLGEIASTVDVKQVEPQTASAPAGQAPAPAPAPALVVPTSNREEVDGMSLKAVVTQMPRWAAALQLHKTHSILTCSWREARQAARALRRLASMEEDPPLDLIMAANVIPGLVTLSAGNAPSRSWDKQEEEVLETLSLRTDALWVLTNLISGRTEHARAVAEAGILPVAARIVNEEPSGSGIPPAISTALDELRSQTVWLLANLCGDGPEGRMVVIRAGVLPALLAICKPQFASRSPAAADAVRNVAWLLMNLCRPRKPDPAVANESRHVPLSVIGPCLGVLSQLLQWRTSEGEPALEDVCQAFAHVTDASAFAPKKSTSANANATTPDSKKTGDGDEEWERCWAVVKSGAVRGMVTLLEHRLPDVQEAACRALGNLIASSYDSVCDAVVAEGVVPHLVTLCRHRRRRLAKDAAWALSNIAAGIPKHIDVMLSAGVVDTLGHILCHSSDDVRKEAAWVVLQIAKVGTFAQRLALIGPPRSGGGSETTPGAFAGRDIVTGLCTLLAMPEHPEAVEVALMALTEMLAISEATMTEEQKSEGLPCPVAQAVEECGGDDLLDCLRYCDDDRITSLVETLLKRHFEDQEFTPSGHTAADEKMESRPPTPEPKNFQKPTAEMNDVDSP